MGRPFVQFVEEDAETKYVCAACNRDVASSSAVVWEGYMSRTRPACLFRATVNMERCPQERQEHLTSGVYTLADVRCKGCHTAMGWRYITAHTKDQKYKEGGTLIDCGKLVKVDAPVHEVQRPRLY